MTDSPIQRLIAIMARLRDPDGGCPWDLEQTTASLVPHTLEEAYEVAEAAEAIADGGDPAELCGELGDLLFQVVFYAQLGREQQQFDFDTVATAISDKLVRRHPHVFGNPNAEHGITDSASQSVVWERLKAAERQSRTTTDGQASALDGVSPALPALTRAAKLSRRAARVGFDWPTRDGALAKVDEELNELRDELGRDANTDTNADADANRDRIEHELGDLLMACANLARKLDLDPEAALRKANRRFTNRFSDLEASLAASGSSPAAAERNELERLWNAAKAKESAP